uniref:DNA-directed RNA polymerase subunit Rpo3 n=1 Tax=Thermofilum pendens TaxID=2269 RepID=A0A7C1T9X2_THEPE
MPRLSVLEKKGEKLVLLLEDVTPALANSIRRALVAEVPTLAIDEVIIAENTSIFWDEMIAHRLALIPLKMDDKTYDALLDCYERGEDCSAVFSLDEEAVERTRTVLSGRLRFEGVEGVAAPAEAFHVEPVSKNIPILKLAKGQRVSLTAIARMGVGREHAKWQPVSAVGYKYKPVIRVLKNPESEEVAARIVETCPRKVFGYKDGALVVVNPLSCNLCRECVEKFPEYIDVRGDQHTIIMSVEGLGTIPVERALLVALDILSKRVNNLVERIKEEVLKTEAQLVAGETF